MKRLLAVGLAAAISGGGVNSALANHRHLAHRPDLGVHSYLPSCASPDAVCSAGTYVGSDPDPRIRAQMLMDFNRGVYGMGNR